MKSPQFRIIVFIIEKGPASGCVLAGLFQCFDQSRVDFDIQVHNSNGVYSSQRTKEILSNLNVEDFDLVIAIGENQSSLVYEVFKKRRYPLPVVFCAIGEERARELTKNAPFMTGVAVEVSSSHVPMQMIFRLCPQAKRYLIPYREKARFGRMSYDIEHIKKYLESRKIVVNGVALNDDIGTMPLADMVKQTDVVVVPESAVTSKDAAYINEICQKHNKPFLGDGQAAQKSGGVYGVKQDFEFMGVKSAELVQEILINKKKPSDVPVYVVKSNRNFKAYSKTMLDAGFFIADDIIASLDGALTNKDLATRSTALSMHLETAFTHGMFFAMSQRFQKESNINYLMQRYVGWPYDDKLNGQHIERIISFDYDHILFLDDTQAYKTWHHAQIHNLKMPPSCTILSIADQLGPAGWRDEARASGLLIDEVALDAPDPLVPVHLLLDSVKNLKNITLICNAFPDKLPAFLAKRVAVVEQECAKHGITLTVIGDTNGGMMDEVIEEGVTDTVDACFFYQDALDGRTASLVITRLGKKNIPLCAGGAMFGQIAPMSYGKNLLKLREYLFDTIHQRYENKQGPEISVRVVQQDLYNICVNHPLCVQIGLDVSPMLSCFATHQCVDTMYERNIAACVNAKARVERVETEEEKIAREAKDAAMLEKMKKPNLEL